MRFEITIRPPGLSALAALAQPVDRIGKVMIDLREQDRVVRARPRGPGVSAPHDAALDDVREARRAQPLLQQIEHGAVDVGRDDLAVRRDRACEVRP